MPRWQVAYLAGASALIGFSLCYVLCDFGGWPLLMYEPYERTWLVANKAPSAAAMAYPGMLVWGLAGALMSASLCIVIAPRWRKSLTTQTLGLFGAWGMTAIVFAGLYFLWGLWPF